MRGTKFLIPALLVGSGLVVACASDDSAHSAQAAATDNGSDDWGDDSLYPELGGKYAQNLTALVGQCTWTSSTSTMAIQGTGSAAQTIIFGLRPADGVFLVNGQLCKDAATGNSTSVKGTAIKRVAYTSSNSAAEAVIVDYIGGVFAAGISGQAGVTLAFSAVAGNTWKMRGTSAADAVSFGTATNTVLNMAKDAYVDISVTGTVGTYAFSLAGGNDSFSAQTNTATGITNGWTNALTVFGGDGTDSLVGGTGSDTLKGGAGADTLIGAAGGDSLYGETGNDVLDQGAATDGADYLDCGTDGAGTTQELDYAWYTARTNPLNIKLDNTANDGESGELDNIQSSCEVISAGSGDDTLSGVDNSLLGTNGNMLLGNGGNDTMDGKGGLDTLSGGLGNDTFYDSTSGVASISGSDVFVGGDGIDVMNYSGRSAVLLVTMDGKAADDGESGEGDNVKADIENIIGGSAADTLSGNDSDNVLFGGAGADSLVGGKGNDTFDETSISNSDIFVGGDGVDVVNYSGSNRTLALAISMGVYQSASGTADAGRNDGDIASTGEQDTINSDVENVITGSGVDTIFGNDLNNEITSGAGADIIYGFGGDDVIDMGAANESVDCGSGDDVLLWSSNVSSNCEL